MRALNSRITKLIKAKKLSPEIMKLIENAKKEIDKEADGQSKRDKLNSLKLLPLLF